VEHSRAQELFSDYLDGELTEEQVGRLEGHLEGCPDCRRELEVFKETVNAVASLSEVKAPEDFASKVHLRLRRRMRHRPEMGSTWEHKIPFETICLLMLAILAALYIILYLLPLMDVDMAPQEPEKKNGNTTRPQGPMSSRASDTKKGSRAQGKVVPSRRAPVK
jgi:anti-sigma factor RsiW